MTTADQTMSLPVYATYIRPLQAFEAVLRGNVTFGKQSEFTGAYGACPTDKTALNYNNNTLEFSEVSNGGAKVIVNVREKNGGIEFIGRHDGGDWGDLQPREQAQVTTAIKAAIVKALGSGWDNDTTKEAKLIGSLADAGGARVTFTAITLQAKLTQDLEAMGRTSDWKAGKVIPAGFDGPVTLNDLYYTYVNSQPVPAAKPAPVAGLDLNTNGVRKTTPSAALPSATPAPPASSADDRLAAVFAAFGNMLREADSQKVAEQRGDEYKNLETRIASEGKANLLANAKAYIETELANDLNSQISAPLIKISEDMGTVLRNRIDALRNKDALAAKADAILLVVADEMREIAIQKATEKLPQLEKDIQVIFAASAKEFGETFGINTAGVKKAFESNEIDLANAEAMMRDITQQSVSGDTPAGYTKSFRIAAAAVVQKTAEDATAAVRTFQTEYLAKYLPASPVSQPS